MIEEDRLIEDQTRLRENMKALTIHYTRSLAEQEDRVATTIWSCFGHLPPVLA